MALTFSTSAAVANATAVITKLATDLVAPAAVWFESGTFTGFSVSEDADATKRDPAFHDIYHVWDFDDVGSFDATLNIPDAFDDRNVAYGKRACHVFRNPGTYTVTHTAYDDAGNWSQTTTEVVIEDPDTAFPTTRTICYDPASNFTGAPTGSDNVSTTGALTSAIAALTQPGRVLFRRGVDITDFTITLDGATYDQDLKFGAYGTGARPILRPPHRSACIIVGQNSLFQHLTFESLDFVGSWNPVTEIGDMDKQPVEVWLRDVSNLTNVMHDCRISGMRRLSLASLKIVPYLSVISDTMIDGWALYGVFGDGYEFSGIEDAKFAMLGVSIQQPIDAAKGSDTAGFNGVQNQQGPFRYANHRKVILRSSYFFSNTSWAAGAQPPIRPLTANQGESSFIFDRLCTEGGGTTLAVGAGGPTPGNYLVEKCLAVGSNDTSDRLMNMSLGGSTVRNSFFYHPNVAVAPSNFIAHENLSGSSAANKAETVNIFNNTFLQDTSTAVGLTDGGETGFTTRNFTNNVHHEPSAGETGDAPINVATPVAGFVPRYGGRKNSLSRPSVTPGAVANGATFNVAYPVIQPASTATSSVDYTTGDEIIMVSQSSGQKYFSSQEEISISSLGANIVVQNDSGSALVAETYWFMIENNVTSLDAANASPATIPAPRPESGSAAYQTATGNVAREDFLTVLRPGTGFDGATAGSPTKGALEAGSPITSFDYYVATTGNDGNTGGISDPFATIGAAAAAASAGQSIGVRGGTYTGLVNVSGNPGTTGNPITIQAYPGEIPIIDGTGTGANDLFSVASYMTIDGLHIRNSGKFGLTAWQQQEVTYKNVTSYSNERGGIFIGGSGRNTAGSNHLIEDCIAYDNCLENDAQAMFPSPGSGWSSGIIMDMCQNSTINRCYAYENWGEGIRTLGCIGADITNCYSYDNFSIQVYLDNCQTADITGNVVFSTGNTAFFRTGAPGKSILAANEDYGDDPQIEQSTTGLNVTTNTYADDGTNQLPAPAYDGSYGDGGGSGTSAFTPNTDGGTYDAGWVI